MRCPISTPSGSIGMVLHHDDVYPRKSSGCCASTPRAHPDKELPCGVYHPSFLGWNNVWNMPSISQQTTAQHEDSCRTCTDKKPSGCCEWNRQFMNKGVPPKKWDDTNDTSSILTCLGRLVVYVLDELLGVVQDHWLQAHLRCPRQGLSWYSNVSWFETSVSLQNCNLLGYNPILNKSM